MNEYQEQQYNPDQEEGFNLKKLLNKIFSRWYWFILSIAVAYTVSWLINRYTIPKYSISSSLIINEEKKSAAELLVTVLDRYGPRKNIENEIAILKSYTMVSKALSKLDFDVSYYVSGRIRESPMYPNSPFIVTPDTVKAYGTRIDITFLQDNKCRISVGEAIDEVLTVGETFRHPLFSFTVTLNRGVDIEDMIDRKYFFIFNNFNSLVNRYRGKVTITPNDKRGTILTLSLSGESAQQEADYLNALMDVYVQNGLDEKNQTSTNAIDFITEQLEYVGDSLRRAEDILEQFRTSNKSFNLGQEGNTILNRLSELESEKRNIKMQLNYYEYLQNYIDKNVNLEQVVAPSIIGIGDPLLNALVSELSKLSSEKALMSRSSNPETNPLIRDLNVKINTVLNSVRENVKQLIAATGISLEDIDKRIEQVEKQLVRLPLTERSLLNIQRDYNMNSENYTFLLKKRQDAAISKASNVADNKVLDYAMPQNAMKISPQNKRNNMIAIALGLLIPLIFIFVIDFFNNTITDLQEIKSLTSIPLIGLVGHNEKDSEVPVAENPASPLSESFRALRTNLHYVLHNKGGNIINVTSTISREGKTFISINLATMIAHSGKKVLLTGLDLRKPKISKVFNMDNGEGISTYLIGDTKYEDLIRPTNINNLYVAISGPVPPNPAELIETPAMGELFERAKKDFDFIIVDTPPVAVVVDSLLLAQYGDVNIFVVRQHYSSKDSILLANDLSKRPEIKGLSLVINDVNHSSSYGIGKYKYSYSYGYGYNYGGYGNYYSNYTEDYQQPVSFWRKLFPEKKE
jgi:capsular exopolysaccharide synthesis family protein